MRPTRRTFIAHGMCFTLCTGLARRAVAGDAPDASDQARSDRSRVALSQPSAPAWIKDLILYEIAPKGFTSPSGPGSGNFRSLQEKLPYLRELGITGIWLAGYSLCDPSHFYNIWTQYAVIDPAKFDPSLGTEEQFKAMVDEAHRNDIRVFLDTITHGLMQSSPIVREHPDWFRGSSWGMADFDWAGGHTDLDDWWVQLWTGFVAKYGIDGFRLDVDIYRPDLWKRIRRHAAAIGRPVVIFEEVNAPIAGITDFAQKEFLVPSSASADPSRVDFGNDVPGVYSRRFGEAGEYRVDVQYEDNGSTATGSTKAGGKLKVRVVGLTDDRVPRRFMERVPVPDGIPDIELLVDNVEVRPIENITVRDDQGQTWQLHPYGETRQLGTGEGLSSAGLPQGATLHLYVATLGAGFSSALLSCHDNGWQGFPHDANPFSAQGSRARFGYSFLFTPTIPIFFSGEEFDATFQPLPGLSPFLYGGAEPGQGRWLYGAQLDWDEIHRPAHRAMLDDVKTMIALRKQEQAIFSASLDANRPALCAVPYESDIAVPAPYLRWCEGKAALVLANRSTDRDANLVIHVPLDRAGVGGHDRYMVSPLWPRKEPMQRTAEELSRFTWTVGRDKSPHGGLAVIAIETV